jgi:hypothetical protein
MHFAQAMVRQTVTDNVRLERLSGGACDVHNPEQIIDRIVDVASYALAEARGAKRASTTRSS